jgi:hypothetical protein
MNLKIAILVGVCFILPATSSELNSSWCQFKVYNRGNVNNEILIY